MSSTHNAHPIEDEVLSINSIHPLTPSGPPSPLTGPPPNFGEVLAGKIYRSSFPRPDNYEFLASKGIKSILTLVDTEISPEYLDFINVHKINHTVIVLPTNKDSANNISIDTIEKALSILSDEANCPVLIHCNKGKHRTGCIVGCLRKSCGWPITEVLNEYNHFAGTKARYWDEIYLREFRVSTVLSDSVVTADSFSVGSSSVESITEPSGPPSPVKIGMVPSIAMAAEIALEELANKPSPCSARFVPGPMTRRWLVLNYEK